VGYRANPSPRASGGLSGRSLAVIVPVETAQEPTGERKGLSAAFGGTTPRGCAVEAAAAVSSAAAGNSRASHSAQ
jgi:hypothetical protein